MVKILKPSFLLDLSDFCLSTIVSSLVGLLFDGGALLVCFFVMETTVLCLVNIHCKISGSVCISGLLATTLLSCPFLPCYVGLNATVQNMFTVFILLVIPTELVYTKFGSRAFSVAGPEVWNRLPQSVRSADTVSQFRRLLKTHYFQLHYCPT